MESSTRTIARLIQQAERFIMFHDWDEAAARCYRILALDLNNLQAQDKLKEIYGQPELVEAMYCSMARLFTPENASPHHQRRKLAFSYRVLSRWRGWQKEDSDQNPPVDDLEEVTQMMDHAYMSGEDDDLLTAWELFVQACDEYADAKFAIQWWMAKQYATHGFFADAAEVLTEMHGSHVEDHDVRYVLAEVRWWRDHAADLTWVS